MKNKVNTKWFFKKRIYFNENDLKFKQWFQIIIKESLNWKAILIKAIVFLVCACILIPISLHLQYWALRISPNEVIAASNGLISVQPIGNPGIEFSLLAHDNSALVFFVESITIILASICLIIVSPKIYLLIPLSFVLIGGIMNTNCRATEFEYYEGSYFYLQHTLNPTSKQYGLSNIVIDYWHFNNHSNNYVIFNFNDTCVISGSIGFISFLIITIIFNYYPAIKKELIIEKKKKLKKQNKLKNDYMKSNL